MRVFTALALSDDGLQPRLRPLLIIAGPPQPDGLIMHHNVKKRSFGQSAAAILVFDAGAVQRIRAWSSAECAEDIAVAERADAEALRAVQEAYHQDTSDINSLASCYRVDVDFVRRMARDCAPAVAKAEQPDSDESQLESDESDGDEDAPAPR